MATTTNYGWTTPDDTALVKDGASAIRTLGSSVDTTTKNLNPETTLGDIAYRSSTANVKTRLGIGSTGQVLTVAGGVPSWAAAATGGMTLLSTTTLSGATVTISSISQDYLSLFAVITGVTNATADGAFQCGPNADFGVSSTINVDNAVTPALASYAVNSIRLSPDDGKPDRTSANNCLAMRIDNYTTSTFKPFQVYGYWNVSGNQYDRGYFGMGGVALTTAITSLAFNNVGGNLSTGTVLLYGVK
jgi:hypothetical protein